MKAVRTILMSATALLAAQTASAQEADLLGGNFSANVAITTDYTFRGISQSATDLAVQGGIDWATDTVYFGVWGSTVDFNDDQTDPFTGEVISDGASTEIDFYFGWTPTIGELPVSIGFIYYFYPGAPQDGDDTFIPTGEGPFLVDPSIVAPGLNPGDVFVDFPRQDYWEIQIGTSYTAGPVDLGLTVSWSPEYYFEAGNSIHTMVTASVPVAEFDMGGKAASLSFGGHAAYLEFLENDEAASTGFFEDYFEYGVGATLTVWGIDFDARYIGTSGLAGNSGTGVFTVSKSF